MPALFQTPSFAGSRSRRVRGESESRRQGPVGVDSAVPSSTTSTATITSSTSSSPSSSSLPPFSASATSVAAPTSRRRRETQGSTISPSSSSLWRPTNWSTSNSITSKAPVVRRFDTAPAAVSISTIISAPTTAPAHSCSPSRASATGSEKESGSGSESGSEPESGASSPHSPLSPGLRPDMRRSQPQTNGSPAFYQLASEPQTPAALLQYLDTKDRGSSNSSGGDGVVSSNGNANGNGNGNGKIRGNGKSISNNQSIANNPSRARTQPVNRLVASHEEQGFKKSAISTPQQQLQTPHKDGQATGSFNGLRRRQLLPTSRPHSAIYPEAVNTSQDVHDDTPLSEPEFGVAKTAGPGVRTRRQTTEVTTTTPANTVPGTYADSSTDGTESTSGTDRTSDEEDEDDDDEDDGGEHDDDNHHDGDGDRKPDSSSWVSDTHNSATPRPSATQGPTSLPIQSMPSTDSGLKLERSNTVVQVQKFEPPRNGTASVSGVQQRPSGPVPPSSATRTLGDRRKSQSRPINVLQYLQTDDDAATAIQHPKIEATGMGLQSEASVARAQPSVTSQYFATQKRLSPTQTTKPGGHDSQSNSFPATQPKQESIKAAAPSLPHSVMQYLDTDSDSPDQAGLQRQLSHNEANPVSTAPTYPEKKFAATSNSKETITKISTLAEHRSRPPMQSASAAYFERTSRAPSQAASVHREPTESALTSPTLTNRPLGHVFPVPHYQNDAGGSKYRKNTQDNLSSGANDSQVSSPQIHHAPVPRIPNSYPPVSSRPLTPNATEGDVLPRSDGQGDISHMTMSMPALQGSDVRREQMPNTMRTFTPPATAARDAETPKVAQPLPTYPYAMQDPRLYYTAQYQNMQQGSSYMVEPPYNYNITQPPHGPQFSNSPDPYRRHRVSLASASGESRYTPDAVDPTRSASQTRSFSGRMSPSSDSVELLSKIQSAMPDLQMLLSRCEEVTGRGKDAVNQVSAPPRSDSEHQDSIWQKSHRIEELEKELSLRAEAHTTERNRMRFELGNLEDQYKELQDELMSFRKRSKDAEDIPALLASYKQEVSSLRSELEESLVKQRYLFEDKAAATQTIVSLEAQLRAANAELETMKLVEASLQNRLSEIVATHLRERKAMGTHGKVSQTDPAARDVKNKEEIDTALKAQELKHDEARNAWAREKEDLSKIWQQEKEDLQKAWQKEKEELSKSFSKEKEDLLKINRKERDELHRSHSREKEEIVRNHEDASSRFRADAEKEARTVSRKHEKALAELERNLESKFDEQYRELESDNSKLRRDYKRTKRDWHLDKERGREEREKLRAAASKMQSEHSNLMKLLEAYSEPTERDREREEKRERREKEQHQKKEDSIQQG